MKKAGAHLPDKSANLDLAALRDEVERLSFELACLQQQYEKRTAYMVRHHGVGLLCNDAMRSAYSDEHERADRLVADNVRLRKALTIVAEWKLPPTGKTWPETGNPMSYEAAFGSNGAQDYIRGVARAALAEKEGGK